MQTNFFSPQSEWLPPKNFPDLSDAKEIAFDLETKDTQLKTRGPGWMTNNGHIIGVAVAVDGWKGYYPIRHENGFNFDPGRVLKWTAKTLSTDAIKIAHNAVYDLGWLHAEGIKVNGPIVDTMSMATILNENKFSYALNSVGKDLLNEIKDESKLKQAAIDFGVDPKNEMYKLPAIFVGDYAEQDADLTLRLYKTMRVMIDKESLSSVYKLEMQILPIVFEMMKRGVRVDVEQAHRYKKTFKNTEKKILDSIFKDTDIAVDIWAADSVAKVFDKLKIEYPRTEKTEKPSFTKDFLSKHEHPIAQKIVQAREFNKLQTTFLDTIFKHEKNNRIHASIHQLRDGVSGTVSGRFSYSNPNLQQLPSRNPEIKKKIRGLFLPEEGSVWGSFDYSQQEPRLATHYAFNLGCDGAEDVVNIYNKDANADFHDIVSKIANISRTNAKTINLGLLYGMGVKKLAEELKFDKDLVKDFLAKFHKQIPFIKDLSNRVSQYANSTGYVATLKGRKCRFELWEPTSFGVFKALPYDQAKEKYGRHHALQRAGTYKALNRLIQGSAADQTKKAMLDCYEKGHLPLLSVHDELCFSIHSEEQAKEITEIMETGLPLKVPSKVDQELGDNWGEVG